MTSTGEHSWLQRRWPILAGLVFVVVLVLVLIPFFQGARWHGSIELEVIVLVMDADSGLPLADVPVTLFEGPSIEGLLSSAAELVPDAEEDQVQEKSTDADGRVTFTRRFEAGGSEGLFEHSGSIYPAGTWIRVAPPGYSTVLLPLDGQPFRPRDIDDQTPIYVTVCLTKSGEVDLEVNSPSNTQ